MKTIEIKNEGGVSVKYDIVNIGCKDCPYCMMAECKYLCRSDKSCNAKANMTDDDDEPKQKVIIYSRVSTEKQTLEQQESPALQTSGIPAEAVHRQSQR